MSSNPIEMTVTVGMISGRPTIMGDDGNVSFSREEWPVIRATMDAALNIDADGWCRDMDAAPKRAAAEYVFENPQTKERFPAHGLIDRDADGLIVWTDPGFAIRIAPYAWRPISIPIPASQKASDE